MVTRILMYVAVMLLSLSAQTAHAGSVEKNAYNEARKCTSQSGPLAEKSTPTKILQAWAQVSCVNKLIWLKKRYPQSYNPRQGGELKPWMIHKRIKSIEGIVGSMQSHDDDNVEVLASALWLWARMASAHLNGEIPFHAWLKIADHADGGVKPIAFKVQNKHVPNREIVKETKLDW